MADKLKIYACSGIGDVNTDETYNYWTDNTDTLNNTRAVNSLLISINGAWIRASRFTGLTEAQRIDYLNEVDLYVVCLKAAQQFAQQPEMLHHAGVVIGAMLHDGLFAFDTTNSKQRDAHLDELLATAQTAYYSNEQYVSYPEWVDWWKKNVEDLNKDTFNKDQKSVIRETIAGIGDAETDNALKMLYDAGTYYLCTYFTKAQLNKLPGKNRAIIEKRVQYQKQVYNYNLSYCVKVCGSAAKVREICTQRVEARFGKPVNEIIDDMVKNGGKVSGVGVLSEAAVTTIICAIITGIIQIVLALIAKAASQAATTSSGTYQRPTAQVVRDGQLQNGDIPESNNGLQKAADFIPFLAIGAAAWYLMSGD